MLRRTGLSGLSLAALGLFALPACEGALAIDTSQTERGGPSTPPQIHGGGGSGVEILGDDGGAGGGGWDAGIGGGGGPQCAPMCAGRTCGPDGCGGTCGSCGPDQACTDGVCQSAGPQSDLCPPTGAEGQRRGDVVPDFDFALADGGRMSMRELCPHRTVLVYWLAEWCGYCRDWLSRDALPLLNELEGEDFVLVILVGETYTYGPGDQSDAQRIREEYGLDAPVIVGWEDEDQFRRYLGTNGPQTKLLMIEGNEIAAEVGYLDDSSVLSVARR